MGHLVNPLLFRLNYSAFWNGSMITNSKLDSYINVFSVYFFNFVRGYFKNYDWVDKNFLFVSSLKFFFINSSIFVYVDFGQHPYFEEKNKIITENTVYFFTNSLKKRLLKRNNFAKKKRALHYFNWQKYFFYKKGLTFFKKKFSFKYLMKNFISDKSVFKSRKFYKHVQKKRFKPSLIGLLSRASENIYLKRFKEISPYTRGMRFRTLLTCERFGLRYGKKFVAIYNKYAALNKIKFSLRNMNNFYAFSKVQKLPNVISSNYWIDFEKYLTDIVYFGNIIKFFNIYFFLFCYPQLIIVFEEYRYELYLRKLKTIFFKWFAYIQFMHNRKFLHKKIFFF